MVDQIKKSGQLLLYLICMNDYDDVLNELSEYKEKYISILSEFNNYKKRTIKEKEELVKTGTEKVILSILPIVDDFERAFEYNEVDDGITLIYRKLIDTLSSLGVERIKIENGTEFNTDEHIAVLKSGNGNFIIDEILSGYRLYDKVIRHAKVIVG